MDTGQLETFCTSEWPTFGVGWPPEGTLNLVINRAVHLVVTGRPGHPDQFILRPWAGISAGHAWLAPTVRHARVQGFGGPRAASGGQGELVAPRIPE